MKIAACWENPEKFWSKFCKNSAIFTRGGSDEAVSATELDGSSEKYWHRDGGALKKRGSGSAVSTQIGWESAFESITAEDQGRIHCPSQARTVDASGHRDGSKIL